MLFSPIHRTYGWFKTRKRVKKRDGNKCVLTGSTERLEVHHIISAKTHPELAFEDWNCTTIASWVHRMYHIDFLGGYHVEASKESWLRFVKMFNKVSSFSQCA